MPPRSEKPAIMQTPVFSAYYKATHLLGTEIAQPTTDNDLVTAKQILSRKQA